MEEAREIIQMVVWPVTLLLVLIILRPAFNRLVGDTRPKRVKYRDLELEFERAYAAAETSDVPDVPRAERIVEIDLEELAEMAPTVAVEHAWVALEASARAALEERGRPLERDGATPLRDLQNALVTEGLLSKSQEQTFEDLRRLRNKVVHAESYELGGRQARMFVELAGRLAAHLRPSRGARVA